MVHPSHAEHCHKLAELGWLYHKIKGYINIRKQDFSLGLVVQVNIEEFDTSIYCTCTLMHLISVNTSIACSLQTFMAPGYGCGLFHESHYNIS